jgi:hypothetical protein
VNNNTDESSVYVRALNSASLDNLPRSLPFVLYLRADVIEICPKGLYMSQAKAQDQGMPVAVLNSFLGWQFLCHYLLPALLAFLLFELCFNSLLGLLNLSRSAGFIFLEFLVFISVAGLIHSCTSWRNVLIQKAQAQAVSRLQEQNKLKSSYQGLMRKLGSISDGIVESLSAITFFARAHLVGAGNTQEARDLREIAERIDQVQLLLKEMQFSADSELSRETFGDLPQINDLSSHNPRETLIKDVDLREPSSHDKERSWLRPTASLRKSARKVLILPVTVRFVRAENNLEFQTFTVNICEEGACIILSGNSLAQEEIIDVLMPPEFTAQARLKWIQPVGTNSFRLGGIEFLGSKFRVVSL